MKETLYMLGLDKDTKKVVLDTYLLRKYMFEKELDSFCLKIKMKLMLVSFVEEVFLILLMKYRYLEDMILM